MTAASAFARPRIQGSSSGRAASVTTGSVAHTMGKRATIVATATVGCVSAMTAGSERPASSRRSATYPARRAKSSAKTNRGWSVLTEVPATVGAACATIRTTEGW